MNIDSFKSQGYIKCDFKIPRDLVDMVVDELTPYWDSSCAPNGISNKLAQEEILRRGSRRLQDAWEVSNSIHRIAVFGGVMDLLRKIYESEPRPFQTLNFEQGTEQDVHSDAVHFNSEPFGMMCGVWVAMEDIGPEQGPLKYYPQSHKLPEATAEIVGCKISSDNYPNIVRYWNTQILKHQFTEHKGILQKGEIIVWSANLLHGGSKQVDKRKTRHSMVTHYYFEGCRPWRPLHSQSDRNYFEPKWIPLVR